MFELILVLGSLILSSFMSGWGLSVVWNWFIPDIFGLPMLSIVQALGVTIVVHLANGISVSKDDEETSTGTVIYATIKQAFLILFTVGIAFVAKMFL